LDTDTIGPLGTEGISWDWVSIWNNWGSEALSSIKVVSTVAWGTGTVCIVEGLAKWVRSNTDTASEEGSLGASSANSSRPLGAEEISWANWSSAIVSWASEDTVSTVEVVSLVAAQAPSVTIVEGLAEWVDLGANSVS